MDHTSLSACVEVLQTQVFCIGEKELLNPGTSHAVDLLVFLVPTIHSLGCTKHTRNRTVYIENSTTSSEASEFEQQQVWSPLRYP